MPDSDLSPPATAPQPNIHDDEEEEEEDCIEGEGKVRSRVREVLALRNTHIDLLPF